MFYSKYGDGPKKNAEDVQKAMGGEFNKYAALIGVVTEKVSAICHKNPPDKGEYLEEYQKRIRALLKQQAHEFLTKPVELQYPKEEKPS